MPKEYFIDGMQPEVEQAVHKAIDVMKSLGAEVREVSLPHTDYGLPVYYLLAPAEASANLARFDGVRYGLRVDGRDLWSTYKGTRGQGFGPEVKRRIMLGTYALSTGYYDAYYLKAQKVRTLIKGDYDAAFQDVDVIACPTSPTTAFKIGEKADDPLQMYLERRVHAESKSGGNLRYLAAVRFRRAGAADRIAAERPGLWRREDHPRGVCV